MAGQKEQDSFFESLVFEVPLYKNIIVDSTLLTAISQSNLKELKIRHYCPKCNDMTLYTLSGYASFRYNRGDAELCTKLELVCFYNDSHRVVVFLSYPEIIDGRAYVHKIGQSPSLADLYIPEVQKYRKLLSKYYTEFSRAIGLNSHGVGIGSFVYLRRVIEYLLEDAYVEARQSEGWDDSLWFNRKVSDRIVALKEYLPKCLVDNRESYAILSKGVHELGEDECLEYFPVLKDFIEMVLDEKLSKARRAQKELEMKKNFQNIKSKIAAGSID